MFTRLCLDVDYWSGFLAAINPLTVAGRDAADRPAAKDPNIENGGPVPTANNAIKFEYLLSPSLSPTPSLPPPQTVVLSLPP